MSFDKTRRLVLIHKVVLNLRGGVSMPIKMGIPHVIESFGSPDGQSGRFSGTVYRHPDTESWLKERGSETDSISNADTCVQEYVFLESGVDSSSGFKKVYTEASTRIQSLFAALVELVSPLRERASKVAEQVAEQFSSAETPASSFSPLRNFGLGYRYLQTKASLLSVQLNLWLKGGCSEEIPLSPTTFF